jgi:hypothetical protein
MVPKNRSQRLLCGQIAGIKAALKKNATHSINYAANFTAASSRRPVEKATQRNLFKSI